MSSIHLQILKKNNILIKESELERLLGTVEDSARFHLGIDNTPLVKYFLKVNPYSTSINEQSYAAEITVDYNQGTLSFRPLENKKSVVLGLYLQRHDSSQARNSTSVFTPSPIENVKEHALYNLLFSFLRSLDLTISNSNSLTPEFRKTHFSDAMDNGKKTLSTIKYNFVYEVRRSVSR